MRDVLNGASSVDGSVASFAPGLAHIKLLRQAFTICVPVEWVPNEARVVGASVRLTLNSGEDRPVVSSRQPNIKLTEEEIAVLMFERKKA